MASGPTRTQSYGRINRNKPLSFSFNGRKLTGYTGDSLASALLANGIALVSRSFKYHRPRGIYSMGVDDPNALVTINTGSRTEPNTQATVVELSEGLTARSQNCWPSLEFDAMSINDNFSRFLAAGFYYKTFMGPTRKSWMFYEHFIRKAAGMGEATTQKDPDLYEKVHGFCDVMVVGGGPAGLAAAVAAARTGARVVLVEQSPDLGGGLLNTPANGEADRWIAEQVAILKAAENVRILTRCSVFGAYDHGSFGLVERVQDHVGPPQQAVLRQRMWIMRTGQAILATGALERPIVFGGNDLPGVMLASAARGYLNHYGVLAGKNIVIFTNNDGAYWAATELSRAGASVMLVDARPEAPAVARTPAENSGVVIQTGKAVAKAKGRKRVASVEVAPFDCETGNLCGTASAYKCDLLCVSGGWSPTLHLLGQRSSKPAYDDALAAFSPGAVVEDGFHVAGAANGKIATRDCVIDGQAKGLEAALACGFTEPKGSERLPALDLKDGWETPLRPVWEVCDRHGNSHRKAFVDLQHDVTVSDVALAHREGYVSVEHLKRYTTLGMASDQGKGANVIALALMAKHRGKSIPEVGVTTFRPPFTPVAAGALAGHETGPAIEPRRHTPMRQWHLNNGAEFIETGIWDRAWYYPKPGEDLEAAYIREARELRRSVGIVDVSTLGKIDVQGPDAAEFLNRIYVNGWKTLPVGRARYGVMLREDGMVFDDGTTTRLSEHHYFMTVTTAGAGAVMSHLEFLLQTCWTDLRVEVTSATDQWAAVAVSGPRARGLLSSIDSDIDFSNEGLPFMGAAEGTMAGLPVRVIRITFTGELGYEIYTPAGFGEALQEAVVAAGSAHDLLLCGIEALGALRVEKGHVAGSEITGRTTLDDLGLARMGSTKKPYVGQVLAQREALAAPERQQFVGLRPVDPSAVIKGGSILSEPNETPQGHGLGYVTAVAFSPVVGSTIGLGLLSGGRARKGTTVNVVDTVDDTIIAAHVTSPHFYDPDGEKARA
ncbi:sarcosine oxidase subunit alpha family protein [Hoeflea sp. TYP-13]|uniref:sarcosine oxidase subunit alpha family protein n=1 Tax=Hoeflea sp. TYP-13 TaxID=3230023 RepID=UPI0034C6CF0B